VLNTDTLSSQFITALPNATGIIPDKILIEIFAHSYMGLPSPAVEATGSIATMTYNTY
jgi:hypothetical protein